MDFGVDLSKEEIKEIFETIDKDGSGHVDFDEFLGALRVGFRSFLFAHQTSYLAPNAQR